MRTFRLIVCLVAVGLSYAQEDVILDIPLGSLKGLKTATKFNGVTYFSFKGIPYAKPPVGSRKFDAPTPPDPWTGVYDATQHRQTCVFFCMLKQGIMGDEDCLYINVYTPDLNKEAKRAVMVYFHPGGFNAGSGDDDIFGPDFLVEQDVVLVTFNSRVGAAGFLSTGDENAPGNIGLKDQVLALKWIQENIVNFGGCKNRVTLFGTSSGAASIQYHMLSPMSRGLFRGAIMESGSVISSWAMQYNPKDMAFKLGEALGIKTTDTKELVDKLKEFSVKEMVTVTSELTKNLNHMNGQMAPFSPVVEPDVGQEIFLTNDPWTLLKTEDIADIPVMMGINLDEASFMAPLFLPNADTMDQHFQFFIPDDLNATDAKKKDISDMMRKFYLNGKALTTDSKVEFTKMFSDILFNAGVLITSKLLAVRTKAPVYEYLFSYYAPYGVMKNLLKVEEGVAHGDELGYLFYSNVFQNKPQVGSSAEKMIRIMTKLWTNFAKDGNPTPASDDDLPVTWEPMGTDDNYLEINESMKMDKGLFKDRVNLWAHIYGEVLGDYTFIFK